MPNWTSAQKSAIDARNKNILVSAAAGSGKTAVLVERVVKLITDEINPVDIDKLLIVTFTNAAALEMKNRISKSLSAIIKEQPNNTNIHRQISLLPNANICTIDSFCMNLVRENFFNLDISQDFKILDDSESVLIEENASNEIIDSLYESENSDFRALVELLSSTKNDSNLAASIKRIYSYIMSQPFPFVWLKNVAELYNPNVELEQSVFKKYIFNEIESSSLFAKSIISASRDALSFDDNAYEDLVSILDSDELIFDNILSAQNDSWDRVKLVCENANFVTMTRKKSTSKSVVAANRDLYKDVLNNDIKPFLNCTSEEYRKDCEYLYPIVLQLCQIVEIYASRMMDMKKDLNAYSFSDIEHFAIDLLFKLEDGEIVRTDLAKEYSNNFAEILVDEYQDTNTAQDTLFSMLSNGHNLFMVGDVKQSIYRFRLAMPSIFTDKKNSFTDYLSESDDVNQRIILDRNFRSRKGICDYTNYIFTKLMSKKVGELDYNYQEELHSSAEYNDTDVPSAQIKLVNTPEDEDACEYEARQVARLILDKIAAKELVKKGDDYQPISFGDFAILFRSTKKSLPIYSKVFSEFGIPISSNNKINLFDNNEVSILLSLLRTIDNPMQDIPLLATLMSVFYGYSVDELSYTKLNYPSNNLYSSLLLDKERYSKFFGDLDRYRQYASSMNVESFIRLVISETSFLSVISAMGNAEQRKLNVLKLLDIAKKYDNGENVGLTSFVRYVDNIISSKLTVESAELPNLNDNSVSMMTVHKSKGLEFPVVILADSAHKYNMTDLSDQIQLNDKLGVGLKVHNEELLYRYNSLQYTVLNDTNRLAMMSENLRVLYVAITRAKEQFISVISNKDINKHIANLSKKLVNGKLSPIIAKHITNDADFILLTALVHKDCGDLRDLCEDFNYFDAADFDLSVEYLSNKGENVQTEEIIVDADPIIVEQISQKVNYSYDRMELAYYSSKRTASSLDSLDQGYKYFASSKPSFLNADGFTPAQKGTAMHAFMQFCDYENAKKSLDLEIARLVNNGFLSVEQSKLLNKDKLNNLFHSDFGNRIFSADSLYREIKVSSFVPVSELEENCFLSDKVLVQGIADCVFEEKGELVLVDYKTDKVDSEEELLNRYKNQLSFYKKAIEKTLNKKVKQVLLYSFSLDKCCIYK